MKNFIFAIFAVSIFSIGLIVSVLGFIALIDPEGTDKLLLLIFGIVAFISFFTSRFLWKLSSKEKHLP